LAQRVKEAVDKYTKSSTPENKQAVLDAIKAEKEAMAELLELYKKMFRNGGMNNSSNNLNAADVSRYLYSSEFSRMSATYRSKKLAELMKKYSPGSKARDIIKTRILEEIRNAGQNKDPSIAQRRLQNLRSNIGSALSSRHNGNLFRALGVEKGRALQNIRQINNYYRRNENRGYGRRYRNENGTRRRYEEPSLENRGYGRRYRNENGTRRRYEEPSLENRRVEEERRRRNVNLLPQEQQTAITNAGGVQTALNTVANVPGGATEVAKAAEALRETSGNASKAVNIKGASPVAIQAVQKLGGTNNTVNVLHGLNTLSQKQTTIKRKSSVRTKGRRKTPVRIRVAELNRVINAVKKQKLISLVAHNVTKTHNIHPNDEKLKKYYKKIIKSNILRTKFSKIVKKAEKK